MADWSNKNFSNTTYPRSFADATPLKQNIFIYGGMHGGKAVNTSISINTGSLHSITIYYLLSDNFY